MKKSFLLSAVVLILFLSQASAGQWRAFITATEAETGSQIDLYIGSNPLGTNGYDAILGDQYAPPRPPVGAYDIRLPEPTVNDEFYRNVKGVSDTLVWNVWMQTVKKNVKLTWDRYNLPNDKQAFITYFLNGEWLEHDMTTTDSCSLDKNAVLISITITPRLTGLNPNNSIADKFILRQNYPNPFNPITQISFDLKKNSMVQLTVYDALGRTVREIIKIQYFPAGKYTTTFNGEDLAAGTYYCRLITSHNDEDVYVSTIKMALVK